jgi:hypothetical protein
MASVTLAPSFMSLMPDELRIAADAFEAALAQVGAMMEFG